MKQLFIENVLTAIVAIAIGIVIDFKESFNNPNIQKYIPTLLFFLVIIISVCSLFYNKHNSQKKYDKNLLVYVTYSIFINLFYLLPALAVCIYYFKTRHYILLTPALIFYIIGSILFLRFIGYILLHRKNRYKNN